MSSDQEPRPIPDQATFKEVISRFATGVTVISAQHDGQQLAMTASAMTSVSVEPPMVLVCINRANVTETAVRESGRFGVSILGASQDALALHFARPSPDKFAGVGHHTGPLGTPLLDDALATLECEVVEAVRGGTHTVFIGAVVHTETGEGDPLTYFRGRFGRLESTMESEVYSFVRSQVLTRALPVSQPIDLESLLAELPGATREHVMAALVRLRAENLVERDDAGAFAPTALTVELVDDLFDARAAIERGVVQIACGRLDDARVAELEATAAAPAVLAEAATGGNADLEAFLRASEAFHVMLVSLAGSNRLVEMYRGLRITGVWQRAVDAMPWWELFDTSHLTELATALRIGDHDRAQALVQQNTDQVKGLLRQVVSQAGGRI